MSYIPSATYTHIPSKRSNAINKGPKTDLFDVFMAFIIALFPIWGMLLRLAVNMSVTYVATFIYFCGSVFVLVRAYQNQRLELPVYFNIYALFVLYTIITNFLMTDLPAEAGSTLKYFYSNYLVTSVFGLFVAVNINLNIVWLRKVIQIMVAVVVLATLTSIIQFFKPDFLVNSTNEEALEMAIAQYGDRKWSIYSWTIYVDIGFSFLSYVSIIFGIGIVFSRRKYWLIFAGFLVSLLNGSRWVLLNSIIISLQDFLGTRNRFGQFIQYILYTVALTALVYVSLVAIGVDLNKLVYERLFQESASTRFLALEVFLDQYPKAPIFGTGGDYTEETKRLIAGKSSQIHVGYLAIFYLYGIIGGLMFISFMYFILRRMARVAKKTGFWGSYYALFGLMLANVTLVTFGAHYHGILMAVIVHNFFKRNAHQIKPADKVRAKVTPLQRAMNGA